MSSPVTALRKAIHAALAADAALTAQLGGAAVYDEAPREALPPYVTFGEASARDWSTATDHGLEQVVVINCWSTQRGARESLDIADRVAAVLHNAALTLTGHRLVNLRLVSQETKREAAGRFARTSLRLRAVTEYS